MRTIFLVTPFLAMLALSTSAVQEEEDTLFVKGATVIDPSGGDVWQNYCIRIANDRIRSVEPCSQQDSSAEVIDARDKWIIPGLWDMHVHAVWHRSVYSDFFSDFVAFGVVGVRDMGGDLDVLQEAREYLSEDGSIGPKLIAAGMVLDGPKPLHPGIAIAFRTAEDARRAVARVASAGADFVKVYTALPGAAAWAVFDEARQRGLPVVGHLPYEITLADAIGGGMSGIEHMAVETGGLCNVEDEHSCRETFGQLKRERVFLTPTLLVRQRPGTMQAPWIEEMSRIASMPAILAEEWWAGLSRNLETRPAFYFEQKALQFARERRITEIAIESGAPILVGTDSGDFLVPPGSSIHEELELLVGSGMGEMDALFAASGRAAEFLGLDDRGRIEDGAVADLVILNGDPLDDIRNTREIDTVILGGRVMDKARLNCLKALDACR